MSAAASFSIVVLRRKSRYEPWLLLAILLYQQNALCGPPALNERYERATRLSQIVQGTVFRDRIDPHWHPDGDRLWYRVQVDSNRWEYVLVDCKRGTRELAFDSELLNRALKKELRGAVRPAQAMTIRIVDWTDKEVLLEALGKRWLFDRTRCELSPAPGAKPTVEDSTGPRQLRYLRASTSGGQETFVVFRNELEQPVELYWVDNEGQLRFYVTISNRSEHLQHTFSGHVWLAKDRAGRCLGIYLATEGGGEATIPAAVQPVEVPDRQISAKRGLNGEEAKGPIVIRDHNIYLRSAEGKIIPLTNDGTAEDGYQGPLHYEPMQRRAVAWRVQAGQRRKVYLIESSPPDQLQPKLHEIDYPKPGDILPVPRPVVVDLEKGRVISVPTALMANPYELRFVRWHPDGERFYLLYNQRGHQIVRLLEVNARTGEVRVVVEERSPTFVDYAHKLYMQFVFAQDEVIWMSERDGWNHLYLIDLRTGLPKRCLTPGSWPVRRVIEFDEKQRVIWFLASGVYEGQDPYYLHFARVSLDEGRPLLLTEANGTHEVILSPTKRYFIDRWSRVDKPPVTELRSAQTGKLICELERSDWSALLSTGWLPPEPFVAKGRDGKTDIWGVIYRPSWFDPNLKYPIVEEIYAGPQAAYVPKAFGLQIRQHAIAELGFIVVQIDAMGTSYRSKQFHDVCWKNLGDAGIPDRIKWIKAAAEAYPYMDLSRVGIYGGSAGGQNALRALLIAGDFYKVGVADCGCHDNRMDKIWWNELWMGWPVGPHYADQSNVTHAHRLVGKLLLIVGELDRNVDPSSTMQVVNALVKAKKDFELLILPGVGHGAAETPYGSRKRMDFLVRHLLGLQPPSFEEVPIDK